MTGPKASSIRSRLLSQLGILFALGMIALYLAASSYARYAADSSYDRLLLGSAGSIAETLSVTPSEIRVDIPYSALDMLSAAPNDRVFYRVVGADGSTVTGYPDLPSLPTGAGERAGSMASTVRVFDADYRGEPVRIAAVSRDVRHAGALGKIWIVVGQTRLARASLAQDLTIRALLPIVGMTVLAIIVVWYSVGRAMRPLEKFGSDLARREPSDLSPMDHPAPREIAPLIGAINDFMGRLDKTIEVLRDFIADAAHQLRTPITALLLQMRAAETGTEPQRTAHLADAHNSAERLARLVDQLLGEAMVAHRVQLGHAESFDMRRVVEQALMDCRPMMESADVRFSVPADETTARGDRMLIGEAIKNVIHNAIKHGCDPETGDVRIDISLARRDDRCVITVTDDGPGMSEAELAQVGTRFASGARLTSGAGLGLAIVADIVRSQEGHISIANRSGVSGLEVNLAFPTA